MKTRTERAYAAPVLLGLGARAEQAVEAALDRPEDAVQDDGLAAVDARHVAADERRQRGQDDEEEDDLRPAGDGHGESFGAPP